MAKVNKNTSVEILRVETLTSKEWREVADRFEKAAALFAGVLRKINGDGQGEQDAEDWLTDAHLVWMATRYVAEFASDKCKIAILPDNKKDARFVQ